MAGEVRIRALTRGDVPWAIALTDTEGWGYSPADFERLLHLEPEGVFLAESGDVRVGITATTTYGPLAYLGTVVVEPEWRGRGVGDALMRAALDYLDGRAVESVRLNSYVDVVPFYGRHGFRVEFENRRFQGNAEGWGVPGVRLLREDDLGDVARLDERSFGAERTRLVSRLLAEFPRTSLAFDDGGHLVGYAIGNTSAAVCEIGPFVGDPRRPSDAESLLQAMFRTVGGPCALTLPVPNVAGIEAAARAGMKQTFRTLRMVRGSGAHGGDPRGVFGLAGLEKG